MFTAIKHSILSVCCSDSRSQLLPKSVQPAKDITLYLNKYVLRCATSEENTDTNLACGRCGSHVCRARITVSFWTLSWQKHRSIYSTRFSTSAIRLRDLHLARSPTHHGFEAMSRSDSRPTQISGDQGPSLASVVDILPLKGIVRCRKSYQSRIPKISDGASGT